MYNRRAPDHWTSANLGGVVRVGRVAVWPPNPNVDSFSSRPSHASTFDLDLCNITSMFESKRLINKLGVLV